CSETNVPVEAARFFDRAAYLAHGGYDENLWAAEDWDLTLRMRRTAGRAVRAHRARILHDESGLTLVSHLRKKFYYGRSLARYARKHPRAAAAQFILFRPAFLRNWRHLAR